MVYKLCFFNSMKKTPFVILLLLCTSYGFAQNEIVIVEEDDNTKINGELINEIQFKDKLFTSNCSYPEVIATIKAAATEQNANLIKIVEHKKPDSWSTCHRMTTKLYFVDNPQLYEKEILWSEGRKLTWNDFKADKYPYGSISNAAAATYCGITFSTNRVTSFKKIRFFVTTVFETTKSWVSEEGRASDDVLLHEQKHFDLCEVYARRLYKELTEANLNMQTLAQSNDIYQKVFDEYNARQQSYDSETSHGINQQEQHRWNTMIADELAALSEYADHY